MNILITSAGRQVNIVKAFKKALTIKDKVFVSDINPSALALLEADHALISPNFSSKEYIDWVKFVCQKFEIDLIFSLNVDDVIILSQIKEDLLKLNCHLIAGTPQIIQETNDKYKLQDLCKELDLPSLKTTILKKDVVIEHFPILAKPRFGKGARGNVILSKKDEFLRFQNSLLNSEEEYVLQEFLKGDEYGFDIINDFEGNYLGLLGRKKILQRNGESFQAMSIDPSFWEEEAKKLSNRLKHKGTVNFDVIFNKKRGYIIDINFRFSGDYIFSHTAGANTPQLYVDCFYNRSIDKSFFQPEYNVVCERTDYGAKRI